MLTDRTTLARYLIEERRHQPEASGELDGLILDVALACKAIAMRIARGASGGVLGTEERTDIQGEPRQRLDTLANDLFLRTNEWGGFLAGMASEEMDEPYPIPPRYPRGTYLLAFDPLDGSANIEVNSSGGSIFSILRAPQAGEQATEADFRQPGTEQVCAGYAIYGPATMLVLTVGHGVHGFTLEPQLGEFILTHQDIQLPRATSEFAIDASNRRFWEPAVQRYVDECLAGGSGPRAKEFTMRWVASLVPEAHRILTQGGVFLSPSRTKDPAKPGGLGLLCQANPVALLIEQAGGQASTGWGRVLEVTPEAAHQRVGLIFGVTEEVERIERYYNQPDDRAPGSPLYRERGLFRSPAV